MSHQDWTEIKWEKKSTQPLGLKTIVSKSQTDQRSRDLLDPETISKPKTWPRHCQQNVQKTRLNQKLSQEEFAKRLNVNLQVIKNLENGKGQYDGQLINKINRVFKVNINSL